MHVIRYCSPIVGQETRRRVLTEPELWDRISAFGLETDQGNFSFLQRLRRQTGWTDDFAQRAIVEYKKFIYLTCVSDVTISPSSEIDQVWCFHISSPEDGFDAFCRDVIGRVVHHVPGRAGSHEFEHAYDKALRLYDDQFNRDAPREIWPPSNVGAVPASLSDPEWNFVVPRLYVEILSAVLAIGVATFAAVKFGSNGVPYLLLTLFGFAFYFSARYRLGGHDWPDGKPLRTSGFGPIGGNFGFVGSSFGPTDSGSANGCSDSGARGSCGGDGGH